jgi:hypothetical protein
MLNSEGCFPMNVISNDQILSCRTVEWSDAVFLGISTYKGNTKLKISQDGKNM